MALVLLVGTLNRVMIVELNVPATLVAVMIAGSAAFATPFGYQTNVLVYQMAGYRYMDFVKIGLPLNLITWIVAVAAITWFFPF